MRSLSAEHLLCGVMLTALLLSSADAQRRKPVRVEHPPSYSGVIPPELEKRLNERLQMYVEYQRNNEWDKVSELLGDYLGGGSKRKLSREQKGWIIAKLRERPMVGFTRQGVTFSTAILDKPVEAKWWYIEGAAEYQGGRGEQERAVILAYHDRGQWYFTPQVISQHGWRSLTPPGIYQRHTPDAPP